MPGFIHRAKTSTEIFAERNALEARVEELEAAIAIVRHEAEHALFHPETCVLAVSRIDTVARGVSGEPRVQEPPESSTRAKTIGRPR